MKKNYIFTLISIFTLNFYSAQTSTEVFETETNGSTSFTDNGVVFDIISKVNTYAINANFPGTGWSGTANDNVSIDNDGSNNQSAGSSFSIKTTSNLFKVTKFWLYVGDATTNNNVSGTVTISGKKSGVIKFLQTKTTGFNVSSTATNGFTLIDLTNLNGQNYSNIIIDELQITLGGNYQYAALDAFTWSKDSSVLGTNDLKENLNKIKVFPSFANESITIDSPYKVQKIEIYDASGKKALEVKNNFEKVDVKNLTKANYFVKIYTDNGTYNSKFIKK